MRAVIDALQSLRGVSKLTATTLVAEVGQLSRFDRAAQLMGYSGAVPSEYSSGGKTASRRITKPATVIFAGCSSKPHGRTVIGRGIYGALRARQETSRSP